LFELQAPAEHSMALANTCAVPASQGGQQQSEQQQQQQQQSSWPSFNQQQQQQPSKLRGFMQAAAL
jgi:hypothetical protein